MNFSKDLNTVTNKINSLLLNKIKEEREKERERVRERNTFKFKLIKFIKFYNTRISILSKPTPVPVPEFKQILQLTKELANKNNSKLHFVYLP